MQLQNFYVLNGGQNEASNFTQSQACRISNESINVLTSLFHISCWRSHKQSAESHLNQRLFHRSKIHRRGWRSGEAPNSWNVAAHPQ